MCDDGTAAEIDRLDFAVNRSLRYHSKMRAHYERLNRVISTLVLVSGSATFGSLVGRTTTGGSAGERLALLASVVVTVFGALDRTFGFSEKARLHADLYRRFAALSQKIVRADVGATDAALRDWKVERLSIEADEPAIYTTVDLMCHNEEARARGRHNLYAIPFSYRLFAHYWNRDLSRVIAAGPQLPTPQGDEAPPAVPQG